ncbi:MAG: hypothetical protein RLZZ299_1976 [Pseudomonadota bacterium]|jgi:uncharacterized SAM-binding protein YcdF (DUF218 family)
MRRWDVGVPVRALSELAPAAREVRDGLRVPRSGSPVDAIVILGAAVRPDGTASESLRARALGAVEAWRAGLAPRIVCTGAHHARPPGEAVVAAALLREAGVPPDAILREDKSRTTLGNLRFARGLLAGTCPRILVVTEPFHMGRALRIAREEGFEPHPWPVRSPAWERPLARARWILRDVASLAIHRASRADTR